ncbi:MAG TPA: glycosyltransferase [Actinocatenispora sp.]
MTDVLLVVRDGGGTAAVEIRVARRLVAHGHRVRIVGPPSVADLASGLDFRPVEDTDPAPLAAYLVDRLDGVDIVVADCMLYGALIAATVRGVPSAALMPTVYLADRLVDSAIARQPHWAGVRAAVNEARGRFGLAPVDSVADQILAADRVLVLTSRAFDQPDPSPPATVEYAGPQVDDALVDWREPTWPARWADAPLVLVSLSTSDQDQVVLLRRLLAALGSLPVRALVTVGPAVDPAVLAPPDNAVVARVVPHSAVLPHAALVVTHAGHGTVISALRAGVPLVCVPMGRDQFDVAARVRRRGAGVTLPADAAVPVLADGIRDVLGTPAYADAARRLATAIGAEDPDRVVPAIVATARARADAAP